MRTVEASRSAVAPRRETAMGILGRPSRWDLERVHAASVEDGSEFRT